MKKSIRPTWVPVVAALIEKGNQVLLGERPEGSQAGVWEFPGGKIEPQETPEAALARELQEELGIDAEIGPLMTATTHSYGEIHILLMIYKVNFWNGEPKAQHHTSIKWFKTSEIKNLKLPEANQKILKQLFKK